MAIARHDVFIVRGFMSEAQIDQFKSLCPDFGRASEPSWHPCLDRCPDYHRIHNNYVNGHVPSIQHGYYFHTWNAKFRQFPEFTGFQEIFEFKRIASDLDNRFMTNLPSQGPIARIVCHQYPRGGGGQAQYIDPVSPFARSQTIIQASQPGIDNLSGGLYVIQPKCGVVNLNPLTRKGDLDLPPTAVPASKRKSGLQG